MKYSVWDYHRKMYDYYEAPGVEPATGSFRAPVGGLECPERAAERLPPGAQRVGSGPYAKGLVAVTDQGMARLISGSATSAVDGSGNSIRGLGDVGGSGPPVSWMAAAGLAVLLWWRARS